MYRVALYQQKDGNSPVREFIIEFQRSLVIKVERQFKYIEEFGLTRENPNLRKIIGTPLWEIRILGKDSVRIICVVVIRLEVMVLHVFKKKGNKTPRKELNLAMKRYKLLTDYI